MGEPRRTPYRGGVCPHGVYLDTLCFNCSPDETGGATAVGDLDTAWAEAEAALPHGWWLALSCHPVNAVVASALNGSGKVNAVGSTPAAALRALAARLRDPS